MTPNSLRFSALPRRGVTALDQSDSSPAHTAHLLMGRWAVWRRERGSDACAGAPVGSALARGVCGSTRDRMAAARAHVLKAAAESVWHETFVQVLMLLHTVAEVESFCGSTVSGRYSTARGS